MSVWKAGRASELRPGAVEPLWPGYLARGKARPPRRRPRGRQVAPDHRPGRPAQPRRAVAGRNDPAAAGHQRPAVRRGRRGGHDPAAAGGGRGRPGAGGACRPSAAGRRGSPTTCRPWRNSSRDRGADFVVIDPLMAFLPPRVAANLDQCVRQVLTPLADLAARTGCAVLLVRHLTKRGRDRAIYRGQGSIGIVAAVRTGAVGGGPPDRPGGCGCWRWRRATSAGGGRRWGTGSSSRRRGSR